MPRLWPGGGWVRLLAAALALAAGLAPGAARAARLDATERRIVAAVERGVPDALALLERTVNVNSGTMNFEGVREVGHLFAPRYEALGFRTRWVDGASWGRAGHLVARRAGKGSGPRVVLIGHLDTVFERDSPFQTYRLLDDSTASGPGVSDMKGGDVVMLLALQALAKARVLDRLDVTVVLMGDEEKAGSPIELARRDLREAARGADVAIGFEDGDDDPTTGVVARRGASGWLLGTWGRASHSSQIFQPGVGSGAVFEAARILAAFRDSLAGEPYLTFNPGVIVGGTTLEYDRAAARGSAFGKSNVVAESTVVAGDLRALTPEQRSRAEDTMRRIVSAHLPGTRATITFDDGYPPLAPTDGNRRLLSMFDRASRDLGHGPMAASDPAHAGAADVSFTAGLAAMAMDGMGLLGGGGHTVRETADLNLLPVQAERTALVLERLARGRDAAR